MTAWQYVLDAGWAQACAGSGFTSEAQCAIVQHGRTLGNVSAEQAFAALIAADDGKNDAHGLLRWYALFMLQAIPATLRAAALASLGRNDPPTAALIYCTRADLTDAEDAILRDAFMPSMSVMRAKVESGNLVRAKVSG